MPKFFSQFLQTLTRKWLTLLIIALVAVGGYSYLASRSADVASTTQTETLKVTRETLRSTIKVVGKAQLASEQKLRFNQVGKVATVYVKEGEQVKQDQLLATLDETDALNDIHSSEISLSNSRINLQQLLKGSTDAQLISARNTVTDTRAKISVAEKNLTIAQQNEVTTLTDLDQQIKLAKQDFTNKQQVADLAQKDLADFQSAQSGTIGTSATYVATITDGISKCKSAEISIDSILNSLNSVLALDPGTETNNEAFKNNLGVLDSNTLSSAEASFDTTRAQQKTLAILSASLPGTVTVEQATNYLQAVQTALTATITAAENTYKVLQASISSASFSQSSLDAFKSTVTSARSSGQSQLSTINSTLTALHNLADPSGKVASANSAALAVASSQNTLRNLEATLATKKASATLEVTTKTNDLQNLQATLNAQLAMLADTERGPTTENVALARNDIALKEISLAKAREALKTKYELHAPFDGIVSTLDFQVGDNLVADDAKYVYLQNPELVQLSISLDQIDIVKVALHQPVEVTFDALPKQKFNGTIEEIDPAPIDQSGVVSYSATITIEKGDTAIFSGMTASAQIIVAESKDALMLPMRALSSRGSKTFVRKIMNGVAQMTPITIGITDGKRTEITSGLNEGDEIEVVLPASATMGTRNGGASGANSPSATGGTSPLGGQTQQAQDQMRQLFRATGGGGGR